MLAVLLFAGCNSLPEVEQRINLAHAKATEQGFVAERVAAGPFELQAFHKGLDGAFQHWQVYLEGDGLSFVSRTRLSPDPTPANPLGLGLALADPAPAVLYLARPCQYRPVDDVGSCPSRFWSSHRFSEEVISSTVEAIETLLAEHGKSSVGITLIGYSGGGTLATLAASRSPRAKQLVTVAAPLDLSAWTDYHGVTSLDGSIDPMAVAMQLTMPQIHLSGHQDDIVPPSTQSTFFASLPSSTPSQHHVLDDFDHTCCWLRYWPTLLMNLIVPRPNQTKSAQASLHAQLPTATSH